MTRKEKSVFEYWSQQVRCKSYLLQQRYMGEWAFIHVNKCGGTSVESALGIPKFHDTALERRRKVGVSRWEAMFTFALVRNPYDRVYSLYKYRMKTNQTQLRTHGLDFKQWIIEVFEKRNTTYLDSPSMFRPAAQWVNDLDGNCLVSRILRLEDVDESWESLARETIPGAKLRQLNKTDSKDINEIYCRTTRDIISKVFCEDFQQFGYLPLK